MIKIFGYTIRKEIPYAPDEYIEPPSISHHHVEYGMVISVKVTGHMLAWAERNHTEAIKTFSDALDAASTIIRKKAGIAL